MHKETGLSPRCCVKKHKSNAFTQTAFFSLAERQQIKNSSFLKWAKKF